MRFYNREKNWSREELMLLYLPPGYQKRRAHRTQLKFGENPVCYAISWHCTGSIFVLAQGFVP